ncbi:LysR family transcriptional regulator [Pseudoxanthomonas winnipegensis]|uniref:LysR family transcriptional regulator n=1 Tax=Pseudoxanthomonas winnipegensis TaxID=2480810 RepID=A0A4Q8M526_9GAMM|nr:LysR family transcriptional regulator [Pseudoxanthomonas winnipegensis]TAA44551.1 LysR family transcriptional regulator [Pseudoxanthomonas winnipegensis]
MDLRQINYFLALYEEGSVTRAAQRMNVVQPALSMQIAKLERELEQKLFERTPKRMVPTAAGRTLHRLVTPIQRDLAAAMTHMANLSGTVSGEVSIGVLSSVTRSVIPGVLMAYSANYPDVRISIADGYSQTFIEWVNAGRLDVAVINRPARRLGLEMIPLLEEEMVLVGARGNAPPKIRSLGDVAALKLVLPSKRHGLRAELERHMAGLTVELEPQLEIDSTDSIADLVARSDWFTVLPSIAVHRQLLDGSLVGYSIGRSRITRHLVVIHQARHPLGPAAMLLVERLREALHETREALEPILIRSSDKKNKD